MWIKIEIKVCIFHDKSIINLKYDTEKKTSITCNGSLIQKFLTARNAFPSYLISDVKNVIYNMS